MSEEVSDNQTGLTQDILAETKAIATWTADQTELMQDILDQARRISAWTMTGAIFVGLILFLYGGFLFYVFVIRNQ